MNGLQKMSAQARLTGSRLEVKWLKPRVNEYGICGAF